MDDVVCENFSPSYDSTTTDSFDEPPLIHTSSTELEASSMGFENS